MSNSLINAAATLGDDIKAFRSSAVTTDGKGDTAARSLLASLLTGANSVALATSQIITAFGNPKSPKSGKPIAKLRGLDDFKGGGAVRKMAETVFDIVANVDIDAPKADDDGNMIGAGAIRPLIVAFILNETDAPKSLRALNIAVKAAIAAHAKVTMPDNSDAADETAQETADNAAPVAAPMSFVDRVNAMRVALDAADDETLVDGFDAMQSLIDAFDARIAAAMAEVKASQEAEAA